MGYGETVTAGNGGAAALGAPLFRFLSVGVRGFGFAVIMTHDAVDP
jgi:hypothetical protein